MVEDIGYLLVLGNVEGTVVVCAVYRESVSDGSSLLNRENTGKIARICCFYRPSAHNPLSSRYYLMISLENITENSSMYQGSEAVE